MQAVTIGRLTDEVIALREELWRRQDMTVFTTDIARISQALPALGVVFAVCVIFVYFERTDSAAEHVTGIGEGQ